MWWVVAGRRLSWRCGSRTGENFVPVQTLDVPLPQSSLGGVQDQILQRTAKLVPEEVVLVIEVPKISFQDRIPRRASLAVPQMAEQLAEVPVPVPSLTTGCAGRRPTGPEATLGWEGSRGASSLRREPPPAQGGTQILGGVPQIQRKSWSPRRYRGYLLHELICAGGSKWLDGRDRKALRLTHGPQRLLMPEEAVRWDNSPRRDDVLPPWEDSDENEEEHNAWNRGLGLFTPSSPTNTAMPK